MNSQNLYTEVEHAAADLQQLAVGINAAHHEADVVLRSAFNQALDHAREAGDLLLAAKAKVDHGQWEDWLKANVVFSVRTAQMYMRIAGHWEEIEEKAQSVALLTYADALELIADKKPTKLAETTAEPNTEAVAFSTADGPSTPIDPNNKRDAELLTWADMTRMRPELGILRNEALLVDESAPGYCLEEAWWGPFNRANRQNAGDPRSFVTRVAALVGWYAPEQPPVLRSYWAWDLACDVLAVSLPRCPDNCPCGSSGVLGLCLLALTLPAYKVREAKDDLHAASLRQFRGEGPMA